MRHELKSWPQFFKVSWVGVKNFEIRRDDRCFDVHDEIILREWDPEMRGTSGDHEKYTGREIEGVIEYITDHEQKPGYVVFGYRITGRRE